MGVCGCGKTEVGSRLARMTGAAFYDGDDFHPPENIAKMSRREPLDDVDRLPWLRTLRDLIVRAPDAVTGSPSIVLACSALKRGYREMLRGGELPAPDRLRFLHLCGDPGLILDRMHRRQGHYMKEEMLRSQMATLEMPGAAESDVFTLSIDADPDTIAQRAWQLLQGQASSARATGCRTAGSSPGH